MASDSNFQTTGVRKFWAVLLTLVVVVALVVFRSVQPVVHASDEGVIVREEEFSPDGRHVALTYQLDTGAFGYSRLWWVVVPAEYRGLNLVEYQLPDRYRTAGWDSNGDLVVEEWEPYYYPDETAELVSGDLLHGVRLHVVPLAASEDRGP